MNVQAHLEITGGIIRLYDSGGYRDRSPFLFALHLVGDDGVAILKGLKVEDQMFGRPHMRAVNECLKAHGFLRAEWDRCGASSDGMMVVRRVGFPVR